MRERHAEAFDRLKGDGGFTLLELLISITLIVVIVIITAGAMRLGSRAVEAGEKRAEALERYRTSMFIVDAQLQSQISLETAAGDGRKNLFSGDDKSLTFASNYSIWGGTRGYVLVAYRVESEGQGSMALYAAENTAGVENKRETKLFDHCTDIHFDYYAKGVEEEGKWTGRWTDEYAIPEKVRISLAFGAKKIALVVPVRVSGRSTTTMPGQSGAADLKEKT